MVKDAIIGCILVTRVVWGWGVIFIDPLKMYTYPSCSFVILNGVHISMEVPPPPSRHTYNIAILIGAKGNL